VMDALVFLRAIEGKRAPDLSEAPLRPLRKVPREMAAGKVSGKIARSQRVSS
jgi:hypothetical protein